MNTQEKSITISVNVAGKNFSKTITETELRRAYGRAIGKQR